MTKVRLLQFCPVLRGGHIWPTHEALWLQLSGAGVPSRLSGLGRVDATTAATGAATKALHGTDPACCALNACLRHAYDKLPGGADRI
jgi:hypothetical protein